jgi:formamidopyrimidine-DNA glycosylase
MPELPEVEVVRLGLIPQLVGRRVEDIHFSNHKLRLKVPQKQLLAHVCNSRVAKLERRAKYLLVRMENGSIMVVHLGMTGKMGIFEKSCPPMRHDHVRWLLDDGREMRFNDTRRFGSLQLFETGSQAEEFFAGIGPEPLSRNFAADYLFSVSRKKKQPVKNFLMDSRVVAGIGNIYASEALFDAHIRPQRPAGRLSRKECDQLVLSCKKILQEAISCGGSTISDFISSSGRPGYFQLNFKVYGRTAMPCLQCSFPIRKKVLAGRASFFCPACQK